MSKVYVVEVECRGIRFSEEVFAGHCAVIPEAVREEWAVNQIVRRTGCGRHEVKVFCSYSK